MSSQQRGSFNAASVIAILYLIALATGIAAIAGVIVAYLKRDDVTGWERSHLDYLIRTFWLGLLISIIGGLLLFIGVGVIVYIFLWIWWLVRSLKSLLRALDQKPIEDPKTLLW